jgi:pimeloyl-ACP methyl ester carboxylesterase
VRHRSSRASDSLSNAFRLTVSVRGRHIAVWRWGDGPMIALVHGWGGAASQLATFVPALLAEGFAAVVFDAPGHGASGGRESSLVHFADALEAVAVRTGPLYGLIGHSLGAAAATYAMSRGLAVERAAFIGAPSRPSRWVRAFGEQLGLSDAAIRAMHDELPRRVDRACDWRAIETIHLAPRLRVPLLVVHDHDDRDVPITQAIELAYAWPDAGLVMTRGLGHRRILRDPDVIQLVASFVTSSGRGSERPPRVTPPAALAPPAQEMSEAALLELELFDLAARLTRRFRRR